MHPAPDDSTPQTIPGDPSKSNEDDADRERENVADRAGQPYLVAVVLNDDPTTFHLRAYFADPAHEFVWADLGLAPQAVVELANGTSQQKASSLRLFESRGVAPSAAASSALAKLTSVGDPVSGLNGLTHEEGVELLAFLRDPGDGIFFDPDRNHDAWAATTVIPQSVEARLEDVKFALAVAFPEGSLDDAMAENAPADPVEIDHFEQQLSTEDYEVPDATATIKTRGSAQRAFSKAVKSNYGNRCAITGIRNERLLIASHIVPWSEDASIRLDPSNGICLSPLVDLAFEIGILEIGEDLEVRVNRERIGDDMELLKLLEPYDGNSISIPSSAPPRTEYLLRRLEIVRTKSN